VGAFIFGVVNEEANLHQGPASKLTFAQWDKKVKSCPRTRNANVTNYLKLAPSN